MNRPADEEVRNLMEIAYTCQVVHCLPSAGGLLDQDAYLVLGMQYVLSAQNEKQDQETRKQQARSKAKSRTGRR